MHQILYRRGTARRADTASRALDRKHSGTCSHHNLAMAPCDIAQVERLFKRAKQNSEVKMNRRAILCLGISSLPLSLAPSFSLAQSDANADSTRVSELPPLPADLASQSSEPPAPYEDTAPVGTAKPSDDEKNKAHEILLQSPFGVAPIDIAQYFLSVGAGAYGVNLRPFVREWPVRANPLIAHFFSSTLTKAEGDTTAWCAAFVNWCLLRSHATTADEIGASPGYYSISGKSFPDDNLRKYSTNNASSGSFRCWTEITSPKRGDIVVFKDKGTDGMTASCQGKGHVTFFLSIPREGWVRVLGGNQSDPGSGGAITVTDMRTSTGSRFMKFVSAK
jgi:CHAP domain